MSQIQLLHAYNGFSPGLYDFGDTENTRLVIAGLARDYVAGIDGQNLILSQAQVAAVQALVDGSGTDVSFTRSYDGLPQMFILDAGAATVLPVMRLTINAATDVIAGERIGSGGVNTFETTITGASLTGEVIPVSVGTGRILSVHIGSSLTASPTLASSNTVAVNQIGKWSCLEADDCNVVYVRFSPPRASGRYCDVSIVGKRRA